MIKYIGSKRVLVPHIVRGVAAFPESARVLDLFSGTSRVARGLKASGRYVIANDEAAGFWAALGFSPRITTAGARRQSVNERLNQRGVP